MSRIRVGVRPWNGASQVDFPGNEIGARNVCWIEIDGVRTVGHVVQVWGKWGEGAHTTKIEWVGVPEFVLVGPDGDPIDGLISEERAASLLNLGMERFTRPDDYTAQKLKMAEEAVEVARAEYKATMQRRGEEWVEYQQKVEELRGR